MFNKYPLDFEALEVGDVITADQIEKHFAVKIGTDAYSFKLMHIQSEINHRTDYTAKITNDEIHILSWQDASLYNDQMMERSLRRMKRHIRKNVQVNTDTFPPELKQRHEHRLMKGAFVLEALKEGRKKYVGATNVKVITE